MTAKDKSAKERYDDEIMLKRKISDIIRDFSEKYDVELVGIDISKNGFYPDKGVSDPPMYNMNMFWKFDYMGH